MFWRTGQTRILPPSTVKRSRQRLPEGFLWVLLIVWATAVLAACGERRRPHVVMIVVDTLRADKLGCYGFEEPTSPEIDEIAAAGVRFERVVAQATWTRPSIGSMLTSRYPRSLGLYKEHDQVLAERFVTLAEVLQSHGYRTLGVTANPNINSTYNFHQGFDRYLDSTSRFSWMRAEAAKPTVGSTGMTPAREIFEQVLELVDGGAPAGDSPWYVQINVMDVHEYLRRGNLTRDELKQLFLRSKDHRYLQAVRQVSADVGAFVADWLARPGLGDTLFILVSDHGEGLRDHPHVALSNQHGAVLYESNLRVPLVLYHPGSGLEPRIVPADVRLLDLMPTLLDYLDLPIPTGAQGVSLEPWVVGKRQAVALPEYFVAETQLRNYDKIAVRTRRWKYIENRQPHQGTGRNELQEVDRPENGRWSNRTRGRAKIVPPMRAFLADWERRFPKQPPTSVAEEVPAEVRKQLQALGYLD